MKEQRIDFGWRIIVGSCLIGLLVSVVILGGQSSGHEHSITELRNDNLALKSQLRKVIDGISNGERNGE